MRNGNTLLIRRLCAAACLLVLPAAGTGGWKAGVATVDITPKLPIRLAGYAARTEPSTGVSLPIHVKALAFEDSTGTKAVLVTADVIGFPREMAGEIASRVEKEFGIPRSHVMLAPSHTHTAPLLDKAYITMSDVSDAQLKTIREYSKFLKDAVVQSVRESLARLAPASLSYGTAEAHVSVNRRSFTPRGVVIGVNPDGPVDPLVSVLAVSDTSGRRSAVLFGYACHGTSLARNDYMQISGDYMGFAKEYLQASQPGVTGLYVPGCGADLNPYPRGTFDHARLHGLRLAGAVAEALKPGMRLIGGPVRCAMKTVDLPFAAVPTAEELRKRLEDPNAAVQRHARFFLDMLDRGEAIPLSYPYPIQVWQFGDNLTFVALGGEVVVDYAIRLRRELGAATLWTIAYANDVCGYIGSARTLYEGGYEADQSAVYYALPSRWQTGVEEMIVNAVKDMVSSLK